MAIYGLFIRIYALYILFMLIYAYSCLFILIYTYLYFFKLIYLLLSITQLIMNPYTEQVVDMINANSNKIISNTKSTRNL